MPNVVISPSVTSSHSVLSPPLGVFQPTMHILKRPSNSSPKSPLPSPSSAASGSLKEREARYQAARVRIFGEEFAEGSADASSDDKGEKRSKSSVGTSVQVKHSGSGDKTSTL